MENKIANKHFLISKHYIIYSMKMKLKNVSKCFLFHITRADNPKFLGANPAGFAERNFGYPLLYGVPRSGMEDNGGDIRARYSQWSGAELRITFSVYAKFIAIFHRY